VADIQGNPGKGSYVTIYKKQIEYTTQKGEILQNILIMIIKFVKNFIKNSFLFLL